MPVLTSLHRTWRETLQMSVHTQTNHHVSDSASDVTVYFVYGFVLLNSIQNEFFQSAHNHSMLNYAYTKHIVLIWFKVITRCHLN